MKPAPTAYLSTLALLLCAGCAAPVDVRSIGTAPGEPPAFEMRGPRLASLDAQAKSLCPAGHQVLRQWQRLNRRADDAVGLAGWWSRQQERAGLFVPDEAQMAVQCAPRVPVVVGESAQSAPAPAGH